MKTLVNQQILSDRNFYLKKNNFNLIRILAAIQVFLTHSITHLNIKAEWVNYLFNKVLVYFPGVPIFFTISGFLIYASFEKNHSDLANFYKNRILRIYPGLLVCVVFTSCLLYIDFPGEKLQFFSIHFFIWLFTQLSIFQFYTPDMLRFWGVGTPNGSLWTISIEMQFYLLIPLIFSALQYFKKWHYSFLILFCLSILVNTTFNDRETILEKLYHEFIFKYLYYFMFGIFAFKMWDKINFMFINKFLLVTTFYIIYVIIFGNILGVRIEYYILESIFGFGANVLLSLWTLAFAFSNTSLSTLLIKDNDLSYGMYVYHMPIINLLNHHNYTGSLTHMLSAFALTGILAAMSWHLVEKRTLKFKNSKSQVLSSFRNSTNICGVDLKK